MNSFNELKKEYVTKEENYYKWSRPEVFPFMPTNLERILDIGCGSGYFASDLKKKYNCVARGIEPNDSAAKEASEKLDKVIHNIFSPTLPELQGKTFDAIIFNDVLEHLVNPYEVLAQCKSFLSSNGCIVASIPNILFFPVFFNQIILKQEWNYTDSGTLDRTHLRFFTKKSIIRMFEDQGYEVLKIEGLNPSTPRRFRIVNTLLFNKINNWKYLQFGVQARLKK